MDPQQSRPPSEVFTDIMQEAFEQSKHSKSQISFKDNFLGCIVAMDWVNLAQEFDMEEFFAEPGKQDYYILRDHTEHLTKCAFDDAGRLADIARSSLPEDVQDNPTAVRSILIHSERELLQIARLGDMQKSFLLNRLEGGAAALVMSDDLPELGDEPPLLFDGLTLSWHPVVRSHISKRIRPQIHAGCPAMKRSYEYEGHKTTLLYAFWRAILDYQYPSI